MQAWAWCKHPGSTDDQNRPCDFNCNGGDGGLLLRPSSGLVAAQHGLSDPAAVTGAFAASKAQKSDDRDTKTIAEAAARQQRPLSNRNLLSGSTIRWFKLGARM